MGALGAAGSARDVAVSVAVRERSLGKRGGWCQIALAGVAASTSIAIGGAIEDGAEPQSSSTTVPAPSAIEPAFAEAAIARSDGVDAVDRWTAQPTLAVARDVPATLYDAVTIEICGYGPVTLPPDDPDPLQSLPRALRSEVLEEVRAEMTVGGDAQARAAAQLILLRSNLSDAPETADVLARQAIASQDPAVYAMALEGCRGFSGEGAGACALLNRAQWARLDPDNAVAWLELGAEAHERGEPDAESDAMSHAALARRSDGYEELLPGLVERTLAGSSLSLRHALALNAASTAKTIWSASRSNHAYEYCASGLAVDTVRLQCEAIAGILVQRNVAQVERRTGVAIGRQLGWPQDRLNALAADGTGFDPREQPALGRDLSCEGVSRVERSLMAATRDAIPGDPPAASLR
jgi:hypothetical protein